jgi:hypothetical protein
MIRSSGHEDREFTVDAARHFNQLESLANNLLLCQFKCASGEIGRRASLRGWWGKTRAGSNPVLRTPLNEEAVVPGPRPFCVFVIPESCGFPGSDICPGHRKIVFSRPGVGIDRVFVFQQDPPILPGRSTGRVSHSLSQSLFEWPIAPSAASRSTCVHDHRFSTGSI